MSFAVAATPPPDAGPDASSPPPLDEVAIFVLHEAAVKDIHGKTRTFPKCPLAREQKIAHVLARGLRDIAQSDALKGGDVMTPQAILGLLHGSLTFMPEAVLEAFCILLDDEANKDKIANDFEFADMLEVVLPFLSQRQTRISKILGQAMGPILALLQNAATSANAPAKRRT